MPIMLKRLFFSTNNEERGGVEFVWRRVTLILQKQELEIALKTIKNT